MMQFGLKELKNTNPADKMSIIAAEPKKILNENTNIIKLAKECEKQLKHNMNLNIDEKNDANSMLSRRFSMIEEQRKVSTWKQTKLLYKRNMSNACRNPLQLMAVVVLGLVQSFLLVMLFGGVGDENINSFAALSES